jgi:hypothetical protein
MYICICGCEELQWLYVLVEVEVVYAVVVSTGS